MLWFTKTKFLYGLIILLLFAGCDGCRETPEIKIVHSPVVAKSTETVTFTATVLRDGEGPVTVVILVNARLVKTCTNVSTGGTCIYTGGPYSAYEGTTVSFHARATDTEGQTDTRGYYYFGVTDDNYTWTLDYVPARITGSYADNEDLVFHWVSDYTSFGDFVDDVEDKIYNVYGKQDIVEDPDNLENFNFYIYSRLATTAGCGTIHTLAYFYMPWRDDDAILHTTNIGDCTNAGLNHFTAEGHFTKAFLHESGHSVFGLADEYDGPTAYFQPADEPNIWSSEALCRSEQTAKGRDPDNCWEFTAGWWGIQGLGDGTVMQVGNVGNPWGIEGEEHMEWYFNQF